MSTHAGSEGIVRISTNVIAEVISFTLEQSHSLVGDTELSDTDESFIVGAGKNSWSGQLECHLDETDASGQEAMTIGAEVALELYPEGTTTGDLKFSGNAIVTSISRSNSDGESVKRSMSFTGNGALTQGTAT